MCCLTRRLRNLLLMSLTQTCVPCRGKKVAEAPTQRELPGKKRAENTLFLWYWVLWDTEIDCLCPSLPAEQLGVVCLVSAPWPLLQGLILWRLSCFHGGKWLRNRRYKMEPLLLRWGGTRGWMCFAVSTLDPLSPVPEVSWMGQAKQLTNITRLRTNTVVKEPTSHYMLGWTWAAQIPGLLKERGGASGSAVKLWAAYGQRDLLLLCKAQ